MARKIMVLGLLLLALCLAACGRAPSVRIERADEAAYSMGFAALSAAKEHALVLEKGDVLWVEIVHDGGNIKLTIRGQDGYEAYVGNRLTSCSFAVGIPESEEYSIVVAGENADGSVKVFKTPQSE